MKKVLKKIMAAAAALAVVGVVGVSANAETKDFYARAVYGIGVPGSVSKRGEVSIHASNSVYTGEVTSMTDIVTRSAEITCANYNFSGNTQLPILYNNTGKRTWRINGSLNQGNAVYYIYASTQTAGTLNVYGTISVD